jgi:WD40 repeat protein
MQDVAQNGTLVLSSSLDTSPYLFDIRNRIRYDLPLVQKENRLPLLGIDISPDENSIAYVERIQNSQPENKIWVVDAKGNVLASDTLKENPLFNRWRWLDEKTLQFVFLQATADGTVALFNPFTKEWQYLSSTLPNFYTGYELARSSWLVDYNSNLEWVIYLGYIGDNELGPIVRDITANKTLWQMPGVFASANIPSWSPLGDEVAVVVNGRLYRITRDGRAIPLPDLGESREIIGFSWSPNGKQIALLVKLNQPQVKGYLMLYDVQSDTVIDYCVEDDLVSAINLPVWSVDSQQFFYKIGTTTPILVDMKQNTVFELSEDVELLGWINSIP